IVVKGAVPDRTVGLEPVSLPPADWSMVRLVAGVIVIKDLDLEPKVDAMMRDFLKLQALVDKKKIVISEDVICEILRLDDAEGVVCLPNEEIFAGLAQMGYEKPSTKLTFYNAFFSKEEVQVPAQDDVDQENVAEEIADDVAQPASPLPPSPVIPSSPPYQSPRPPLPQAAEEILKLKARVKKLERLNKGRMSVDINEGIELVDDQEKDAQVKGRQADTQAEIYNIDLDHTSKVLSMQEDIEVQEVVEVVNAAKLMTEVVTAAATQVVAISTPISAAKPTAKPKVLKIVPVAPTVSTRKRKGVVIRDPEEELHDDTPAETFSAKDKGKGILVEDPKPMKKKRSNSNGCRVCKKIPGRRGISCLS
nr:hypothetical protein [Tanacetum cinerariifolium]